MELKDPQSRSVEEVKKEVLERALGGSDYRELEVLQADTKQEFFIASKSGSIYQFNIPNESTGAPSESAVKRGRKFSSKGSEHDRDLEYFSVFPIEPISSGSFSARKAIIRIGKTDFQRAEQFKKNGSYILFSKTGDYIGGLAVAIYVRAKEPSDKSNLPVQAPEENPDRIEFCIYWTYFKDMIKDWLGRIRLWRK